MKDLSGRSIKSLVGDSRLIFNKENEAIVVEKYQGKLSFYICALDNENIVQHFFAYEDVEAAKFVSFLSSGQALVEGIRIGPLFHGEHVRRIVVLKDNRNGTDSFFFKTIPLSPKESSWENNGSGWAPVAGLGPKAPGLIVFLRNLNEQDLLPLKDANDVFFLHEKYEVYIETVLKSYAFGRLVERETK